MKVATSDLTTGMTVRLPYRGIVRTVDRVVPSGYVNGRGEPLYNVYWSEGRTEEWSAGNSAAASSLWDVLVPCSYGAGFDPATGCDELVDDPADVCPAHAAAAGV